MSLDPGTNQAVTPRHQGALWLDVTLWTRCCQIYSIIRWSRPTSNLSHSGKEYVLYQAEAGPEVTNKLHKYARPIYNPGPFHTHLALSLFPRLQGSSLELPMKEEELTAGLLMGWLSVSVWAKNRLLLCTPTPRGNPTSNGQRERWWN